MKNPQYHTVFLLVSFASFQFSNGLPLATTPASSVPFPWAKLVQQKFVAAAVAAPSPSQVTMTMTTTTTPTPVTAASNFLDQINHPLTKINFPPELFEDFLKQLINHIKAKTGNQTVIEITATVAPSPSLETTTTSSKESTIDAGEQSITNVDAPIEKVYLDWVKTKRQARQSSGAGDETFNSETAASQQSQIPPVEVDSEILLPQPAPEVNANPQQPAAPPQAPNPLFQVPLAYSPASGAASAYYPFGMFNPLAAFKMQKLMAQAQVDAALAALNITTTPKPTKIKLKFMLPVGGTLPPGLESYIVS